MYYDWTGLEDAGSTIECCACRDWRMPQSQTVSLFSVLDLERISFTLTAQGLTIYQFMRLLVVGIGPTDTPGHNTHKRMYFYGTLLECYGVVEGSLAHKSDTHQFPKSEK